MKRLFIFCFVLIADFSLAHPGIGIVMDSKGNVYYTDLTHVWKIDPEGNHEIAVRDVHTHLLYVDENDNLYGEHVWYEGERIDKWGHYVWKKTANGNLDYPIPRTEGFPINNTLYRDSKDNEYYADKFGIYELLRKKSPDSTISLHANQLFDDIRWIYASKTDKIVYVIDHLTLKKVTEDGNVTIITDQLKESSSLFDRVRDMHYLMGMWEDEEGNLYVAVYGAQKVKKITPEGNIETILEVKNKWSPSGGLFGPDGSLWTLEYSTRNKARVRKIAPDGGIEVYKN